MSEDEESLDPEEAERQIADFIASAEELPGPPLEELADQVAALTRGTWESISMVMDGVPHNKLLATQLLLSQRARALPPDDPEQWRLYAASTLLSGMLAGPDEN